MIEMYATEIWQKVIIVIVGVIALVGFVKLFNDRASKLKKWKPARFTINKYFSYFIIVLGIVTGCFMQTPFFIVGVMFLFGYTTLIFVDDRTIINGWTSDGKYVGTRSSGSGSSSWSGGGSHSFGGGHSSGGGASR